MAIFAVNEAATNRMWQLNSSIHGTDRKLLILFIVSHVNKSELILFSLQWSLMEHDWTHLTVIIKIIKFLMVINGGMMFVALCESIIYSFTFNAKLI